MKKEGQFFKRIKDDKKVFSKNRDMIALGSIRVIIGEIQRDPDKDYSDENITKILKKLRKMTLKNPIKDPLLISMIDTYIPLFVSDVTVIKWIKSNFSYERIKKAGAKKYFIIGITKKNFSPEDINCVVVRDFLEKVIEEGEEYYNAVDNPKLYDINVGPEVYQEFINDVYGTKKIDKGD